MGSSRWMFRERGSSFDLSAHPKATYSKASENKEVRACMSELLRLQLRFPFAQQVVRGRKENLGLSAWLVKRANQGPQDRPTGPQGAEGPPGPSGVAEHAIRVMRLDCTAAPCRGECDQNEVLLVGYCGLRRSGVTVVNERTITCQRGAATSPLVMVCAKAAP